MFERIQSLFGGGDTEKEQDRAIRNFLSSEGLELTQEQMGIVETMHLNLKSREDLETLKLMTSVIQQPLGVVVSRNEKEQRPLNPVGRDSGKDMTETLPKARSPRHNDFTPD